MMTTYGKSVSGKKIEVVKGNIIQITNPKNPWYTCILVVDEVKSWGVQGYVTIPLQGDAFYKVKNEDFVVVGIAKLIME